MGNIDDRYGFFIKDVVDKISELSMLVGGELVVYRKGCDRCSCGEGENEWDLFFFIKRGGIVYIYVEFGLVLF